MRFDKVLVIVDVQLKAERLQQYLPCSAEIIGQTLAEIAVEYEKEKERIEREVTDKEEQKIRLEDLAYDTEQKKYLFKIEFYEKQKNKIVLNTMNFNMPWIALEI